MSVKKFKAQKDCSTAVSPSFSNDLSFKTCSYRLGIGNYSIIVIIVIVLLAVIDIVYFSLTSDNRNQQLLCSNRGNQRDICKFTM